MCGTDDETTFYGTWKTFQDVTGYFENAPPSPSRRYNMDDYPGPYKRYEDAHQRVSLPEKAFTEIKTPLVEAVARRRSKRNFLPDPLSLDRLAFLLWATQGITAQLANHALRAVPSAGALYPVETYLAVRAVDGLEAGIWHLDVERWALEQIRQGDVASEACRAAGDQVMVELAAVNFFWTAVLERTCCKYYERGFRYVYEDIGHVSHALQLASAAFRDVGCAVIGSFLDDRSASLLGVDRAVEPVIMIGSVGKVGGEDFLEDRRVYLDKLQKHREGKGD